MAGGDEKQGIKLAWPNLTDDMNRSVSSFNSPAMVDIPRATPMVESIYSPYNGRLSGKYSISECSQQIS